MKIAVIGSAAYQEKMNCLKRILSDCGDEVRLPTFDSHPEWNELQICESNREMIEWADKIYIMWDQRSMGTIFDFGMVFALRKSVYIWYIESKTFANLMRLYQKARGG